MEHSAAMKCLSEFIGTYFLVLTVGCNVLTGSVGAAISIGSILMVMIFALGSVSGGHFNPAVTFAVALATPYVKCGKLADPVGATAGLYMASQLAGGLCAGLTYLLVCRDAFILAPVGMFNWGQALCAEVLYSAALVYVVLNCACAKLASGNHYFGLAIGFTVVSAALAIGSVSGCSLNPAVSFGSLCVAAGKHGAKALLYLPLYFLMPFLGSGLAFGLFWLVRPDDFRK